MSNKKAYCGANTLPKNKRYGTLDECNSKRQIRLYNKADLYNNIIIPDYKNAFDYTVGMAEFTGSKGNYNDAINAKFNLIKVKEDMKKAEKVRNNSIENAKALAETAIFKTKKKLKSDIDKHTGIIRKLLKPIL